MSQKISRLVAEGVIVEEGSNYIKYEGGKMICFEKITLTFNDGANLRTTWTYPEAFLAGNPPFVLATPDTLSSTNTFVTRLGMTAANGATPTSCTIVQYRINAQDNFVSGDTITCNVLAIGRWE